MPHMKWSKCYSIENNNIIYALLFNVLSNCGTNYMGETGMQLQDCISIHRQTIRDPNVC